MQPVGVGGFRNSGSDAGRGAEHSFITSHILFRFSIVYELQLGMWKRRCIQISSTKSTEPTVSRHLHALSKRIKCFILMQYP